MRSDLGSSFVDALGAAILETVSDAILVADRDGIIQFWNPGATRIFGFAAETAIGQPLDLIIPERLRARHARGYEEVIKTGTSRYGSGDVLSVPALTSDGRQISVEFTIVLLRDANANPTSMVAILRDVTPRFDELRALKRRVAELEEKNATVVSMD